MGLVREKNIPPFISPPAHINYCPLHYLVFGLHLQYPKNVSRFWKSELSETPVASVASACVWSSSNQLTDLEAYDSHSNTQLGVCFRVSEFSVTMIAANSEDSYLANIVLLRREVMDRNCNRTEEKSFVSMNRSVTTCL
ncbi:hypothetical protein TNCT_227801 [Trichonephila clavata]|uniref:Uncharacterized protein n=1 Tax=Trichonephila clavata TaxID=2740835 RepID=A0A8X6HH39_TRICU|nr:hypothetical protein TNCT_227801 [Trichonephila clavata]